MVNPASVSPGTSNGISEYQVNGQPLWLSGAADGNLWLTDTNHKQLLRFAPDRIPPVPDVFGAAQGVNGDVTSDAEDAGGNVWFTEFNSNRVGVVSFKPVNTQGPDILGVPKVGQRVTCGSGGWTNNPTAFTYQWLLDGTPISGETNQSHDVQANESGHQLTCQVTASNGSGTGAPATSAPVTVSKTTPLLQNTALPVVLKGGHAASTVVSGDVVTCQPGTWNSSSITRRNYFWAWATSFLVRVGKLSHYQQERTVLNSGSAQTIKLPDLPGYVPGNLRETSVMTLILKTSATVPRTRPPNRRRCRSSRLDPSSQPSSSALTSIRR